MFTNGMSHLLVGGPKLPRGRERNKDSAGGAECSRIRNVADLTNDFSWSRSRDGVFQDCKRRYFYQYYGSWGGWASDAPEDIRRLYILKQLATRQMWAGRIVHDAIEMALSVYRQGGEIPVEPFVRDAVERMRGEWKSSKAGRYRELPKNTALF